MTKRETKHEGFLTAKDHEHGLFGNSKATHKDVIGTLKMGSLMTNTDKKKGLASKKGIEMGMLHTKKDQRGLM